MAFELPGRRLRERRDKAVRNRTRVDLICFAVIIVVATLVAMGNDSSEIMDWDEHALTLNLSEEMVFVIPYEQIQSIVLVENAETGMCISGVDSAKMRAGLWQNEELGEYVLCAYESLSPVMQITTAEQVYRIALEKAELTVEFYDAFIIMLTDAGYKFAA